MNPCEPSWFPRQRAINRENERQTRSQSHIFITIHYLNSYFNAYYIYYTVSLSTLHNIAP